MTYIFALIPSLCWGSLGLISTKFGGNASQQTLGLTYGGLLFGIISYFTWVLPHGYYLDSKIALIGLISGVLWTVGQAFQFVAIKAMGGVSVAVPLSMTSQLVGNALLAAALLGEWTTAAQWIIGVIAIILIIIGVLLIQAKSSSQESGASKTKKGLLPLLISTLGFVGYFITPKLLQSLMHVPSSVISVDHGIQYMITIIFPQSIGMVICAYLYVVLISHENKNLHAAVTWKNTITGIVWAIGNIVMFISIANIGQTIASTLSQLGFIVGAFGGILILHEKKTSRQLWMITLGSIVALIGAIVISNINLFATFL